MMICTAYAIQQTIDRFEQLTRYKIPSPFISSFSSSYDSKPNIYSQNSSQQQANANPLPSIESRQTNSRPFDLINLLPQEEAKANIQQKKNKEQEPKQEPKQIPNILLIDDVKDNDNTLVSNPIMPKVQNIEKPVNKLTGIMEEIQRKDAEEAKHKEDEKLNKAAMMNNPYFNMYMTNMGAMSQINPMMFASMAFNGQRPSMQNQYGYTSTQPNPNVIKPAVRPQAKPKETLPPKKEKDEFDELYSLATNIYSNPIEKPKKEEIPKKEEKSNDIIDLNDVANSTINSKDINLMFKEDQKKIVNSPTKTDFDDLFRDANPSDVKKDEKQNEFNLLL